MRALVDRAADVQLRLVATALELPAKLSAGVSAVRSGGIGPLLGSAAAGALRVTGTATRLPREIPELLHRRRTDQATPSEPPIPTAAAAVGAPGAATADAEAAAREQAARAAIRTGTSVDEALQAEQDALPPARELPLPNFDHMTLGSLRAKMQRLSIDELLALRAYEQAHADRLPVVTMLENRIAKLRREQSERR